MSNDASYTTEYVDDARRMVLPRRSLPTSLVRVTRSVSLLSLLTVVANLSPLVTGGQVGIGGFVLALVALVAASFALLVWQGHSVVVCRAGRLTLREEFGPLYFQRSYELSQLQNLAVTILPLATKGKAATPGLAEESVSILAGDIEGRGRRVMLFGYPAPLLSALLTELKRQ